MADIPLKEDEFISPEEEELDVSQEELLAEINRRASERSKDVALPGEEPAPGQLSAEEAEEEEEEPTPEPEAEEESEQGEEKSTAKAEKPEQEEEAEEESPLERIERLHNIERERMQAALELQRAHASRLAGEIGHLRNTIKSPPATEAHSPDFDGGDGLGARIAQLEGQLAQTQQAQVAEGVTQVVAQEAAAITSAPDFSELQEEIKQVTPKFETDYAQALDSPSVDLARLTARAVFGAIMAEARAEKVKKVQQEAAERRKTQKQRLRKKKLAAASSSTGGAKAAPRTKVVSLDDAPVEDIRAEIERRARLRG